MITDYLMDYMRPQTSITNGNRFVLGIIIMASHS